MSKRFKSYFQLALTVLILGGALFAVANQKPKAESDTLKVDFLDVGQGDSEYIKTPSGKDILIDGGPDNSVLNQLGEVMAYSDHEIDLIILSHPHADHITGLVEVLKRYKVDEVWETGIAYPSATYDEFHRLVTADKIPDKKIKAGDSEDFGGVKITVLYPLSDLENKTIDNLNNSSDVVRLDYKNFSVLFPGDLEKAAQEKILRENIHATILKMPHHGSQNGAGEDFFKIVRPAVAIIEVGKNNTYGHPHAAALNLLKNLAIKYYRTDQDGRIQISSDGISYTANIFPN